MRSRQSQENGGRNGDAGHWHNEWVSPLVTSACVLLVGDPACAYSSSGEMLGTPLPESIAALSSVRTLLTAGMGTLCFLPTSHSSAIDQPKLVLRRACRSACIGEPASGAYATSTKVSGTKRKVGRHNASSSIFSENGPAAAPSGCHFPFREAAVNA